MPDDVIVEQPVPEVQDDDFSYIVDDVPQKDEATLALEAEVERLRVEKEQLAAFQQQAQADEGFNKLAEQIAAMQKASTPSTAPQVPNQPAIDPQALIEEVNKGFYDNPAVNVMKLLDPIMQNMQKQNSAKDAERDLQISKLSILADEAAKGTYIKYQDEIESIVASKSPSQTAYKEAISQVQMMHMDDIIAERVKAQVEEMTKQALAQSPQVPPKAPAFTNATGVQTKPPEDVGAKHEKIFKPDVPKVQQWMLTQGMNWSDADDRDWAIGYLRDKGAIK